MTADDVIQSMTEIYSEPNARNQLLKYPQFIRDIIFIVDLDTELNMNGDVLENSIKEDIHQIIKALRNIKADTDAEILQQVYNRYLQNPDDEMIDELYAKMYIYNDLDIWKLLEIYVEREIIEYKNKSPFS
jgi:hypothetical protein